MKKSLSQQLQRIVDDYTEESEIDEIDLDEVAEWAVKTGLYERKTITITKQRKRELVRLLRTEHFHDPQGREPRKWHPVRIKCRRGLIQQTTDRDANILFDTRQYFMVT